MDVPSLFGGDGRAIVGGMPFADELIGMPTALALIRAIEAAVPGRPLPALRNSLGQLQALALRQRSDLLRDALLSDLDNSYDEFAAIIRRARDSGTYFAGWLIWPVTSAVAERALRDGSPGAFDDALTILASLTGRLSSEFAVRPLLRHNLGRSLSIIEADWVTSPDADVRRLASEGTRPYLPWATRVPELIEKPAATLGILSSLYRDDSEYVRRSVANHLNDVGRHSPDAAITTARSWLEDADHHTASLVRHGLRTLIKKGHPEALALVGFHPAALDVTGPLLDSDSVPIGGELRFTVLITNLGKEPSRLSIDYAVHHRKPNGTTTRRIFKLAVRTVAANARVGLQRVHSFRVITTRTYYPGAHAIELLINGINAGRSGFSLTPGNPD